MIQILGLLGIMYFDAVVVFVSNSSLLFRLAMVCELRVTIFHHFHTLHRGAFCQFLFR